MIGEDDMNLIKITDDVEVAVQEILQFYRRFHSMRFVRDRLVLRMNSPLPPGGLKYLQENFADIIDGGTIEAIGPLPEEANEVPEKPRLALSFNRRAQGRLRKLIDYINAVDLPKPAPLTASV